MAKTGTKDERRRGGGEVVIVIFSLDCLARPAPMVLG
jgi:hypothetical protein